MGKTSSEIIEGDLPPPGEGGYRVAIYKQDELKGVYPLSKDTSEYVRYKHKKHKGTEADQSKGVQKKHKEISKDKSAKDKPKRILTDKQKENLARGREKAAANRAEKKKLAESSSSSVTAAK